MNTKQFEWMPVVGWKPHLRADPSFVPQLVLVFGATSALKQGPLYQQIRDAFPDAHLLGCSTAGEIQDTRVSDESIVITAIQFAHTQVCGAVVHLDQIADSYQAGQKLAERLVEATCSSQKCCQEGLRHVFVLSDGLHVNGSQLAQGIAAHVPKNVTITGGLAGDGARFGETLAFLNSPPQSNVVAAVGLCGTRLAVGFGSLGGWDSFGTERLITRSAGNVLYELDGRSALELYKQYLGEQAKDLPASGLLFPLCIRTRPGESGVVRTILSVSETDKSVTFAGDIPQGALARLMKANFDRLIDGAVGAAEASRQGLKDSSAQLAILISCVGRKLVLKQRIEEEVEGVRDVLGPTPVFTGFYSYGELCPFAFGDPCELHNQTMTITTLAEI